MSPDIDAPFFVSATQPSDGAVAMAMLCEEQFSAAQALIPDFNRYLSYEDWLDYREGFQIGLAMAGVDVKTIDVVLSPFLAWCRLSEIPASERALDAFASMILPLRDAPPAATIGIVSQKEFDAYANSVEAFAPHIDFDHWRRYRNDIRERIVKSGARVGDLPVEVSEFIEWSRCLGQRTSEASLDAYATLALELLTQDAEA